RDRGRTGNDRRLSGRRQTKGSSVSPSEGRRGRPRGNQGRLTFKAGRTETRGGVVCRTYLIVALKLPREIGKDLIRNGVQHSGFQVAPRGRQDHLGAIAQDGKQPEKNREHAGHGSAPSERREPRAPDA